MPTTLGLLSGETASAISVIGRLEVFVASTAWLGAALSASANTRFLVSRSSITASITKSASLAAAATSFTTVLILDMTVSTGSLSVPLEASFSRLALILSSALSSISLATSTMVTSKPFMAKSSAIPCPIVPAPITATRLISMRLCGGY